MFKQKMSLVVRGSNERLYTLLCEPEAPLGEVYDAVCTMKNVVLQQMVDEQKKEQEKQEQEKTEEQKEESQ